MKSLGTKLKELRLDKSMSQKMLAKKMNVSDKLISKWETDNAVPALDYLKMYCEIFGVSIEYLTSDYKGDKNMKHCEKCGKSISSNAKFCENCGHKIGSKNTFIDNIAESIKIFDTNNKKYIAYLFCVLGTFIGSFALIPLLWCIPMTQDVYKYYKGEKTLSKDYKICILIFCSIFAGFILLNEVDFEQSKEDNNEDFIYKEASEIK